MAQPDPAAAEQATRLVRAIFQRLKALGDALHRDLGVTASMRAVLESLEEGGEDTVARIARAKRVSRQHVRLLVNALIRHGLAASRPNPADRRAPLIGLTRRGRTIFSRMRRRERRLMAEMAEALAGRELGATLGTLSALRDFLDRKLEGGDLADSA